MFFENYCNFWKLKVNINKTKDVVFTRGRMPENLQFTYNGENIDFVDHNNYLGVLFSKHGSYTEAKKLNVKKATTAMYDVLKEGRKLNLSVKCQYDLLDKIAKPILL